MKLGIRKFLAWLAVFALVAAATVLQRDVPANAKDLLEFATGSFFLANAIGKFNKNGEPS